MDNDQFGERIGCSRWFNGQPDVQQEGTRQTWRCPVDACGGEMVSNGVAWLTSPLGYHHTCNRCKFTAALRGVKYPRNAA